MFAYEGQLTCQPPDPTVTLECRHKGSWPNTTTYTLPYDVAGPSTCPPEGTFNTVTRFVPEVNETEAERSLRKKKRRQEAKAKRPAWRR